MLHTLVLCGDYHHSADIPRSGLEALNDPTFTFDWQTHAQDWSNEQLNHYPLTVLTRANHVSESDQTPWMTPTIEKALLDYVRQGHGLFVIHSGTALYDKCAILRPLLGGIFLSHPAQCPVTVEPQPDHPLTAGSTPFTLVDEHYQMALDDPEADVFLNTLSEHGSQPGGWCRHEGAGRVCVLSPGHNLDIWLHPSFQALLRNGLHWCAKQD